MALAGPARLLATVLPLLAPARGDGLPVLVTLPPPPTLPPLPGMALLTTAPPFNCKPGLFNLARRWSEVQRSWCCKHEEQGCPDSTSSTTAEDSSTTTSASTSTAAAAEAERKEAKETSTTGTTTTTPVPTTSTTTHTTKSTTSTKTSTTTSTTSTTVDGCQLECSLKGVTGGVQRKATCKSHIQHAAFHDFLGDPNSCNVARDFVIEQCPSCASCTPHGAGCGLLEPITTQPPKHLPPCDIDCPLQGQSATCGSRISWASKHSFGVRKDSCKLAYILVTHQCSVCDRCTPTLAGCDSGIFDCDAGYDNWQTGWSLRKKQWCCEHKGRGCPTTKTTTSTSTLPFDCQSGLARFKTGWSRAKKSWCCKHEELGCEGSIDVLKKFDKLSWQDAGSGLEVRRVLAGGLAVTGLGLAAFLVVSRRRAAVARTDSGSIPDYTDLSVSTEFLE